MYKGAAHLFLTHSREEHRSACRRTTKNTLTKSIISLSELGEMAEEDFMPLSEQVSLFCLASDGRSGTKVIQPFPRSPKLIRKTAGSPKPSEGHLPVWLEELKKEKQKAEAHLESIKKRKANLNSSSEAMKQQVQECFEGLHMALQEDERAVLDMIEQDRRETSSKLNRILQEWNQHLSLLQKYISTMQSVQQSTTESLKQLPEDFTMTSCRKKLDPAEEELKMNEEKIQKLMKTLRNISKDLKAQLQRKSLLLVSSNVVIDKLTCHKQITMTSEGRTMCLSEQDHSFPNDPLRFDQLYCALGSVSIKAGQHYWEVDVHCCPAWAVGVAYGSLQRRGRDKESKLGRNRCSWSLEFKDGHLMAWHNDRHVALPVTATRAAPDRVGVFVNYQKGRVIFYDAKTMRMLQEFSAMQTAVFDRAHHFTEPLYPAFCFYSPRERKTAHYHMEICDLSL
ncbi:tripartite motif-containing protein 14-like [Xyrauchen texanus]|uniref:tripartite motif-containing protein 14-like n=1 Tax=Xyrauchen texanus TaxID=154827 RepID=UPI002241A2E1|nr:tripartite motif-containing protein 14-like [Xyrauchen texanus]